MKDKNMKSSNRHVYNEPIHFVYNQGLGYPNFETIHFCTPLSRKRGDIKSHSSVCPSVRPSVCHKNFNLAHIFWSIKDRALIFGMHDPCDKPFQVMPSCDLDLWPSSRSKLLPSGGPQFSEFACSILAINSLTRDLIVFQDAVQTM